MLLVAIAQVVKRLFMSVGKSVRASMSCVYLKKVVKSLVDCRLRCGFKDFLFSPLFGEDEPILTSIFFRWVVQPPASRVICFWWLFIRFFICNSYMNKYCVSF